MSNAGIADRHSKYMEMVNNSPYPASLELSLWLGQFIMKTRPTSICDIGSGFTSWLIRQYGIERAVSYEFIPLFADFTKKVFDIDTVGKDALGSEMFDLIIVDTSVTGDSVWRVDMPEIVSKLVNPGGYIVFDDYNWRELEYAIAEHFGPLGWSVKGLAAETSDSSNRFACLIGPCQ